MKLQQAVKEFTVSNRADGLSEDTVVWYEYMLTPFVTAHPEATVEDITTNEVRQYVINVRAKYESPATIAGHMRALHRFWTWSSKEYGITSPMRNVRYPRKPKPKAPKAIKLEDITALFVAAGDEPRGIRDKAIIALLADTGVRAGGVISLKTSDVDFGTRRVLVTEKGEKLRSVPFSLFTARMLLVWINHRHKTDHDHLFYNIRTQEPLTVSGLYQVLKRLRKKAGLTGRANPHSFRHSFAREYLKSGGDLATLSKIMGHEDIATTASFYAVFTENELSEEHRDHSQIRFLEEDLRKNNSNGTEKADDDTSKNDSE